MFLHSLAQFKPCLLCLPIYSLMICFTGKKKGHERCSQMHLNTRHPSSSSIGSIPPIIKEQFFNMCLNSMPSHSHKLCCYLVCIFFKKYFSIGPLHEFKYAIPLIKRNLALTFLPNNSPVSASSLDYSFFFSIFLPICSSNPLYILPLVYTTALITVNDDIRAI